MLSTSVTRKQLATPEFQQALIGQQVVKRSGKPFKSGAKIGTVKGLTVHPTTQRACFTFEEDDTYVECGRCTPWEA